MGCLINFIMLMFLFWLILAAVCVLMICLFIVTIIAAFVDLYYIIKGEDEENEEMSEL